MAKLTLVKDEEQGRDELTQRQRDILAFINESIQQRGYPPTLREIGARFGIRSTNGVNDHLRALEKKGYLHREDLKSRALRPVDAVQGSAVDVPLLGRVAAGQPILAEKTYDDTVKIDRFFVGNHREVFALRVQGDSMIDDGIYDGDYVFVRKQLDADAGEIVVAMIEGEATVKRYFPEGDSIRFQPANAKMAPIVVKRREFRSVNLLGVVVGVYRKLRH
jgi:repressor LexA